MCEDEPKLLASSARHSTWHRGVLKLMLQSRLLADILGQRKRVEVLSLTFLQCTRSFLAHVSAYDACDVDSCTSIRRSIRARYGRRVAL